MDTDPNSEVSALLDALGDSSQDATDEIVSEAEGQEETTESSADEHQAETTEDANSDEAKPLVVEFDGKQWELPEGTPPEVAEGVKKVADELKADYTRKQQARAEEERRIKTQAQSLVEAQQMAVATYNKRVELERVNEQLRAIEDVDFNALVESDPQQAIRLQARHTQLQAMLSKGQAEMQQIAQAEAQRIAAEKQKAKQSLIEAAPTIIPGYNAKIDQELMETVLECGFSAEEAGDILDPRLLKLVNLARMGRQMQKAAPKELKKVAAAPTVIKSKAPVAKPQNQAAADRLRTTGRPTELMKFL